MERAPQAAHPLAPAPARVPGRIWGPNAVLSAWIANQFPPDYRGYVIDVGASDGISINSTFMLEKARWTILSVEPNPCYHGLLKTLRAWVETCAVDAEPGRKTFYSFDENPESYSSLRPANDGQFTSFEVEVRTLDQLLAKWEFPRLDVLCIDTEGTELDVLKGFDIHRWMPKIIIAESWTEDTPLDPYLDACGYANVKRFVHNNYYVRKDP